MITKHREGEERKYSVSTDLLDWLVLCKSMNKTRIDIP